MFEKICKVCGDKFRTNGKAAKYCQVCGPVVKKQKKKVYNHRYAKQYYKKFKYVKYNVKKPEEKQVVTV